MCEYVGLLWYPKFNSCIKKKKKKKKKNTKKHKKNNNNKKKKKKTKKQKNHEHDISRGIHTLSGQEIMSQLSWLHSKS